MNIAGRNLHPFFVLIALIVTLPSAGQTAAQSSQKADSTADATPTFRSFTRLVTIQVVAKDRHGRHVEGLKPEDFELFEENEEGRDKKAQKISTFQEVHFAELAKQAPPPMKVPAGVYTNAVTLQKNPVPPTIILVDDLNTKITDQSQIYVQVERIAKAIPKNTPVAIFLLGSRLILLQDFTTDPELLKLALKKANSSASAGLVTSHPFDNANEASAQVENLRGHESDVGAGQNVVDAQIAAMAELAKELEEEQEKLLMRAQVESTLDVLIDIGHYVAGYPGRKNLIWISNSFPIHFDVSAAELALLFPNDFYRAQVKRAASVLNDAKIAVYPINPAGVQPHAIYGADAIPRDYSGQGMADTMSGEIAALANRDRTMRMVAEDTGGVVCNGSNDLAECFTRAFDDSSSYYEISYYPDLQDWNGEYRQVILHSKRSGVQLEYRHGYYAGQAPWENKKQSQQAELQEAACRGYLDATSVVFAATKLPVQSAGELKFYMGIEPQTITLSPTSDGGREFSIEVAACSFDKKGKPLQLLSQPINGKLDAKQYQTVAQNGLAHVMAIPAPLPAGVRLLVRDVPTNHIGTVYVNVERVAPTKTEDAKAKGQ